VNSRSPNDYAQIGKESDPGLLVEEECEVALVLADLPLMQDYGIMAPMTQLEGQQVRDKTVRILLLIKDAGDDDEQGVFRIGRRRGMVPAFVDIDQGHPPPTPQQILGINPSPVGFITKSRGPAQS
jgi:hypothetical protein